MIETRRFEGVDAFLEVAGTFLEAREPAHHLSLGIVGTLRAMELPPGALVAATRADTVVATAVWSRTWDVVLSEIDDPAALPALVDALAADPIPGVHGPIEHVEAFARAWADRTGARATLRTHQRIYALERVAPPAGVAGRLRAAEPRDRDRLVEWVRAFDREAMGGESASRGYERIADELIGSPIRRGYVWEDDEAVSMCQATGATPNGIRIGAVYTPPELRGRGYASACVAAASQQQLDAGRRWCFLFTDVANPTSNRIYQAIGYTPIRDVRVFHFDTRTTQPAG